jgi:hypothetical protein
MPIVLSLLVLEYSSIVTCEDYRSNQTVTEVVPL